MREQAWDIVIVGSGLAGLSRAWVAHQRGLSVALLESGADDRAPAEAGLILQHGLPPQLLPLDRPARERWQRVPGALHEAASVSLLQRDELEARVLRDCLSGVARLASSPLPGFPPASDAEQIDLGAALRTLKCWLSQRIDYFPDRTILAVEKSCVYTLNGIMRADRVVVTADACSHWLPHSWAASTESTSNTPVEIIDLERTMASIMHAATPGLAAQH
ncbi:glycine/D-amino acid oxidase-like deaminating enzyme [Silvimonas terrae]|uniref:Glycine/D-amino acid oxidase-like deaminating enzyme n=1 Tax=Silvimonas terrae TaxID=300266 RepID=A0A840RGI7_9NEIS|nr:FAD-dependent oxidoreductase [Silvimonas terrae]MBB5191341.1 glycine/D-amino acid oxidase-like deaminating enzyme [Silvimonas terrae]